MHSAPFWTSKALADLTDAEWESLCDGCGLCCLHKLEDEESGDIVYTAVACRLFDTNTCRCRDYERRFERVPACINVRSATERDFMALPPTCAYRLRWLGEALPAWHPLVSGAAASVHRAGISVRGRVVSERDYPGEVDANAPLLGDSD